MPIGYCFPVSGKKPGKMVFPFCFAGGYMYINLDSLVDVMADLAIYYQTVEDNGTKASLDAMLWDTGLALGACRVECAPLKGAGRAFEKVVLDYHGDVSRLWDLVRGSLVFYSEVEAYRGVEYLTEKHGATVRKDRIAAPLDNGYRDIMLDIEIAGVHCEVQVHLEAVINVKERYHGAVYEVERSGGTVPADLYAEEKAAYEYAWEVSRG